MSEKTTVYPIPALLVLPFPASGVVGLGYPTYWDQVRIRAVTVDKVNGDKALIRYRKGENEVTEIALVSQLASTPEKALAMLAPELSALIGSRAVHEMTRAAAESAHAAVTDQAAQPGAESQPQPLAGPKHRERFSYANT